MINEIKPRETRGSKSAEFLNYAQDFLNENSHKSVETPKGFVLVRMFRTSVSFSAPSQNAI